MIDLHGSGSSGTLVGQSQHGSLIGIPEIWFICRIGIY